MAGGGRLPGVLLNAISELRRAPTLPSFMPSGCATPCGRSQHLRYSLRMAGVIHRCLVLRVVLPLVAAPRPSSAVSLGEQRVVLAPGRNLPGIHIRPLAEMRRLFERLDKRHVDRVESLAARPRA